MIPEWVLVVGGAGLSATLYLIAYFQVRRRFPDRAGRYLIEALVAAAGATVAAGIDGWTPLMVATAPAFVATVGFLAGKGSVARLLPDGRDGEDVPPETARARKRFAVIFATVFVVWFVVELARP